MILDSAAVSRLITSRERRPLAAVQATQRDAANATMHTLNSRVAFHGGILFRHHHSGLINLPEV
jgi:hypothetical protein